MNTDKSLDVITLDIATPLPAKANILLIYTGGTFGMGEDKNGMLVPFDFSILLDKVPVLRELPLYLTVVSFNSPIDSSNIHPSHWTQLGRIIEHYYDDNDGFVILHGTDTMAYTASALSFLLEGLNKPVILTGAQLPITNLRSDAHDNLVTALEIASSKNDNSESLVPEVCIYFDHKLLRGNRAQKVQSNQFDAFNSGNYPVLARSGIQITYDFTNIMPFQPSKVLSVKPSWSTGVLIVKLFPGIEETTLKNMLLSPSVKGIVLETFGMGNAMDSRWFVDLLTETIEKGIFMMNVSQCLGGEVVLGKYKTSKQFEDLGIISGMDITSESAITKMMYILGKGMTYKNTTLALSASLAGEMS